MQAQSPAQETEEVVPQVVVLSGPSGIGKGTLMTCLMARHPVFVHCVSHTTRPPRPGERDGVHYHFTDWDTMRERVEADAFIEHTEAYGAHYGTSVEALAHATSGGRICLMDLDINGCLALRRRKMRALIILLLPPDKETIRRRLTNRLAETPAQVDSRVEAGAVESDLALRNPKIWDAILINRDAEETIKAIEEVIREAKMSLGEDQARDSAC